MFFLFIDVFDEKVDDLNRVNWDCRCNYHMHSKTLNDPIYSNKFCDPSFENDSTCVFDGNVNIRSKHNEMKVVDFGSKGE